MKTITYNPETHALVPLEPTEKMFAAANKIDDKMARGGSQYGADIDQVYYAMIDAAPQPEQVESKPVPDFRGYAALGTGQYLLNACPATEVLPAELVISIATEEEKAGRVIGDLKVVEPGTEIDPSSMAVRLAFFSVSGLDALEQQLRILREESFPNTTPQPDRTAELEQLRQRVAEKDEVIAEAGEMLAMRDRQLAALEERRCEVCGYAEYHREHTGCLRKQVSTLKVELRDICSAIDDPACDLTLTAVECIKKLKAENESLKLDAERYRWLRDATGETPLRPAAFGSEMYPDMRLKLDFPTIVSYDAVGNVTTLDQAIDALAQGDK